MLAALEASVVLTAGRSPLVRPARRPPRAAAAGHAFVQPRALFKNNATAAAPEPAPVGEDERQKEHCVGASVYDRSHAGSKRGYGTITAAAPKPGRWRVGWDEEGRRACCVDELYLELSLIHHTKRAPPTAMGQDILVVLGSHKGKAGTTIKRVGDGWQCRLEGEKGTRSLRGDHLHATGAAPPGAAVAPFEPECLASALAIAALPGWLSGYETGDATAIDLVLLKPDSRTWLGVLLGERSIGDLSDDEALSLRHVAARKSYMKQAGADAAGDAGTSSAAAAPGSSGAADLDISAIRAGLQRVAAGNWTIKFGCPAASKGCPFMLEVRRRGGSLEVWQMCSHQFHDPASAAERGKLRPAPQLQQFAALLLGGGVKPAAVANMTGSLVLSTGDPLGLGIDGGSKGAAHFASGRVSLTRQQVVAIQKQMFRASGFGRTSDAQAVALYVVELKSAGCLGFYQPYKAACGTGGGRKPEQPLIVVTQTPFQKRLLAEFGRHLVFMDTTFGVTRYGFPLTALLVQDEAGCYVPAGFMLASAETEEMYECFLRTLLAGAREVGDGTFKFGFVMIDKSKAEIAAVNVLAAEGLARTWLLCYFHFLQEWERYLVSKESGLGDRADRHKVLLMLASLAHWKDRTMFEQELGAFCVVMHQRGWPAVAARMEKHWKAQAEHWAWWGRLEVLHLQANTNNGPERCFGLIKYTDLQRNAQSSVHQLLVVLHTVTVPRYIQNRAHRLAGRTKSDQQQQEERVQRIVDGIVARGAVQPAPGGAPGLTWVYGESGELAATVCLGDLSCTCDYSVERPCFHLRAAAKHAGFTHALRRQAAAHLVGTSQLKMDAETGLYSAPLLAAATKAAYCRPRDGSCTCHDCALHGVCCHLLAAAQLPGEQRAELALVVEMAVPAAEDEAQPIDIKGRTFQQPASEPLGDDWAAELRQLQGAHQGAAAVIKQTARSDPTGLRAQVAECGRMLANLPEEEAEQARPEVESLHKKLALLADGVALRPTRKRSGKQLTKQSKRSDTAKLTHALFTGRRKRKQADAAMAEVSDALPSLRQKLESSKKYRGVTKPGNVQGTTLRNGSTHHRLRKAPAAAAAAVAAVPTC